MALQLRDVIDEILRKKSWVQDDLAQYIGIKQPNVSKMRVSSDWDLHWQAFVKLTPLLKEIGIDPAQELNKPSDAEVLHAIEQSGKKTRGNAKQRKKSHETALIGSIQTRRIGGSRAGSAPYFPAKRCAGIPWPCRLYDTGALTLAKVCHHSPLSIARIRSSRRCLWTWCAHSELNSS